MVRGMSCSYARCSEFGFGLSASVFVKILDYSRNFLVSLKQHSPFTKAKRVSLTPTHSEEGHE